MADGENSGSNVSDTRRRLLKAAAVGGATMLAGCGGNGDGDSDGGDDGDSDGGADGGSDGGADGGSDGGADGGSDGGADDTSTEEGPSRIDREFRIIPTNFNPPDMQFNYLNPTNWAEPVHKYLYDRWVWYMPSADEYRPAVFSDWSTDGTTLTATIAEGQTWHDGDPVTAEDVVGHWTLMIGQQMFVQGQHQYFESVEATGDRTVEFTMHQEFNPDLVVQSTFHGDEARLYLKPSLFEEYMSDVRSAVENGNTDELESIYADIQQTAIDTPVGSYYAKESEVSSQYYRTETYDEYANSENINWTTNKFVARGEQQQMINEITAGNVDATPQFSIQNEAIMSQWPEDRILVEVPAYGGRSVIFNTETVPRPLRRAIAWAINANDLLEALPPNFTDVTSPAAGMHNGAVESWLDGVASDFQTYTHSAERATQILEDADYSQDGDSWVSPDGSAIELTFSAPPWADSSVPFAQVCGDNLNNFGINTSVQIRDGATWNNDLSTGSFDLSLTGWGAGPHPFFFLENVLTGAHAEYTNIVGTEEWEAPPVGEWDGDMQTYNIADILSNLRTIQSNEEMRTGIQELSWVVNYHMPVYTAVESFNSPHLLFPDRFDFTTDDEAIRQNRNPIWDLPRYGELQAVE